MAIQSRVNQWFSLGFLNWDTANDTNFRCLTENVSVHTVHMAYFFLFQIHSVLMPFGLKRLSTASHPIYPLTGAIKEFGGFEAILFVDCRT